MAVTIMCPNLRCRKILMIPESMRGNRVRCSYCGMVLRVPKKPGAKSTPDTITGKPSK